MSRRITDVKSLFAEANRTTIDGKIRIKPLMPDREENYHYLLTKDNPQFSKTLARGSTFVKLAMDPLFVFIYEGDLVENIDTAYVSVFSVRPASDMSHLRKMKKIMEASTGKVSTLESNELTIPTFMIVTGISYDYYSRVRRLIFNIPFSDRKDAFTTEDGSRVFVNSNMTARYMKSINAFGNDTDFYGLEENTPFTSYAMAKEFMSQSKKEESPEKQAVMERLRLDSEKASKSIPAQLTSVSGDSPTVYHDKIYREKYRVTEDSVTISGRLVSYEVLMRYVLSTFTKEALAPVGDNLPDPFGRIGYDATEGGAGNGMFKLMQGVRRFVADSLRGQDSDEEKRDIFAKYKGFEEDYRQSWEDTSDSSKLGFDDGMSFTTQEIIDYSAKIEAKGGKSIVNWSFGPFSYPITEYPSIKLEVLLYELLRGYHLDVIPSTLDLILRIKKLMMNVQAMNLDTGVNTMVLYTADTAETLEDLDAAIRRFSDVSGGDEETQEIITAYEQGKPISRIVPLSELSSLHSDSTQFDTAPSYVSTTSSNVSPTRKAVSPPFFGQGQAKKLVKGMGNEDDRRLYSDIKEDEDEEPFFLHQSQFPSQSQFQQVPAFEEQGNAFGTGSQFNSPPAASKDAFDTFFGNSVPANIPSANDTYRYSDVKEDELGSGSGSPDFTFPSSSSGFPNSGFPSSGFPNSGFPSSSFPSSSFPSSIPEEQAGRYVSPTTEAKNAFDNIFG